MSSILSQTPQGYPVERLEQAETFKEQLDINKSHINEKKYLTKTLGKGVDFKHKGIIENIVTIRDNLKNSFLKKKERLLYAVTNGFENFNWVSNKTLINKLTNDVKKLKEEMAKVPEERENPFIDFELEANKDMRRMVSHAVSDMLIVIDLLKDSGANKKSLQNLIEELDGLDLINEENYAKELAIRQKNLNKDEKIEVEDNHKEHLLGKGKGKEKVSFPRDVSAKSHAIIADEVEISAKVEKKNKDKPHEIHVKLEEFFRQPVKENVVGEKVDKTSDYGERQLVVYSGKKEVDLSERQFVVTSGAQSLINEVEEFARDFLASGPQSEKSMMSFVGKSQTGKLVSKSDLKEKIKEYYSFGNAQNLLKTGFYLISQINPKDEDREHAFACFYLAEKLGSLEGSFGLAVLYKDEDPAASKFLLQKIISDKKVDKGLKRAAERSLKALIIQARDERTDFLEEGMRHQHYSDDVRAFKAFEKAAELGSLDALNRMGHMYEKGQGVEKNLGAAIECFEKAAEQNFGPAKYNLGMIYANRLGNRSYENLKDAYDLIFDAATTNNEGIAWNQLGVWLEQGLKAADGKVIVKKGKKAAFNHYSEAEKLGSSEGRDNLIRCYKEGIGVAKNKKLAKEITDRTKEKEVDTKKRGLIIEEFPEEDEIGDTPVERGDGFLLKDVSEEDENDRNIQSLLEKARDYLNFDDVQAFKTFEKAAELGSSEAFNSLGTMYERGQGVKADLKKAIECYQKAADQGLDKAKYNLAIAYLNSGDKSYKNLTEAYDLISKAADENNEREAWDQLGKWYEKGLRASDGEVIVEQNEADAFKCYDKASELESRLGIYNLIRCYKEGIGVEKNLDKVAHLEASLEENRQRILKTVSEEKNIGLMFELADIYKDNDPAFALRLYRKALDLAPDRITENKAKRLLGQALVELHPSPESKEIGRQYIAEVEAEEKKLLNFIDQKHYKDALSMAKELADTHNDIDAACIAAKLLISGGEDLESSDLDPSLGMQYLSKALEAKLPEALNFMGMLSESGLKDGEKELVLEDLDEAIRYYSEAAEQGDVDAKFNLAELVEEKDPEKSAQIYLELARERDKNAERALLALAYRLQDSDDARGIKYLEDLADLGNRRALNHLAICYDRGIGVAKDHQKAKKLFEQCAKKGSPVAKYNLALLLHKDQEVAEAVQMLKELAPHYTSSAYLLGFWHETGKGVNQDLNEALAYYKEAAELKSKKAVTGLYRLGEKFLEKGDVAMAKEALELADQYGDVEAGDSLGHIYESEENMEKAFELYQSAAEQDPQAKVDLARCYQYGIGTEQNLSKAIELFESIAEEKPTVMESLGEIYLGQNQQEKAIEYYKKAVEAYKDSDLDEANRLEKVVNLLELVAKDDAEAMLEIGNLYENGLVKTISKEESFNKARKHYKIAIGKTKDDEIKNEARFLYGYAMLEHRPSPTDNDRQIGIDYLREAANSGHPKAIEVLIGCYQYGIKDVVAKDLKKAEELEASKLLFANRYKDGKDGVKKDVEKALSLYESIKDPEPEVMLTMAKLYAGNMSEDVSKNIASLEKAKKWYDVAASVYQDRGETKKAERILEGSQVIGAKIKIAQRKK